MQTLPISKVKDRLNELVDEAIQTQEHVTITKNGVPAAVLVSADEWESLQETLFWLSRPGLRESLVESDRDVAVGRLASSDDLRSRLGLPQRTAPETR